MRFIRYFLGILTSICLILTLLIGSIEITAFADISFYEEEYRRNNVLEAVSMEMPDLMEVTQEMLSYLRGERDDLNIVTTMAGERREFFNDREKAHMVDVRNLNLGAVSVMYGCFFAAVLMIALLAVLYLHSDEDKKNRFKNLFVCLCRSFQIGAGLFLSIAVIGGLIVSTNFDKYWRIFHTVFFTNDLWLLDPRTDMLINIVPLDFFINFVLRCTLIFAGTLLTILAFTIVYLILVKRKHRKALSILLPVSLFTSLLTAQGFCIGTVNAAEITDVEITLNAIPTSESWPDAPELESDAAILIERSTGTILYEKNALKSEYPASTTKIMTALLTLENGNLNDTVSFSKSAIYALTAGASHIGMTIGEELTVEDCLYGLLLPSANEVANALAEYVSGSMSAFVDRMNTRAEQLGCINTNFANPNGLHDNAHMTCAYDLAQIFLECLNTPNFIRIDSAITHVIAPTNLVEESRPMRTTHKMLLPDDAYYNETVICGKTGHTDFAGGCLVTYAKQGSMELVCVILNATQPNQYTDTQKLLDYGFRQFRIADAAVEDAAYLSVQGNASTGLSAFHTDDLQSVPLSDFVTEARMVIPADMELSSVTHTLERSDSGTITGITYSIDGYTLAFAPVRELNGTVSLPQITVIPASELKQMELPKPNYLLVGILLVGVFGAVIAIICAIRSTPDKLKKRREKSTQVYKNVNLKKIKIK